MYGEDILCGISKGTLGTSFSQRYLAFGDVICKLSAILFRLQQVTGTKLWDWWNLNKTEKLLMGISHHVPEFNSLTYIGLPNDFLQRPIP